jgi:tRNA U55 pseudouridine synthase TruB
VLQAEPEHAAEALRAHMLPLAAALRDHASCTLNDAGMVEVRHGRPLKPEHLARCDVLVAGQQPVAMLDEQGELRALGRADEDRIVIIRGMSQASKA